MSTFRAQTVRECVETWVEGARRAEAAHQLIERLQRATYHVDASDEQSLGAIVHASEHIVGMFVPAEIPAELILDGDGGDDDEKGERLLDSWIGAVTFLQGVPRQLGAVGREADVRLALLLLEQARKRTESISGILSRAELGRLRGEVFPDTPENRESLRVMDAFLDSPPPTYPEAGTAEDLAEWCMFLPPTPDCKNR